MNEAESKAETKYLRGLFPSMTPEQGLLCAKEFMPYDARIVRQVIDEHRMKYSEFVNLPGLREALRAAVARRHADRRAERERELAIESEWKTVADMIAELSDEDLEDMKTYVLANTSDLNDFGREVLARLDPRKSRTLMSLITHALKNERNPPAPTRTAFTVPAPLDLDFADIP